MNAAASSPLLPVYRRSDIVMTHGEGCYLFDDQGKRYLDFAAGIAVNALGHGHPALVNALKTQSEKLWHCSNLFHTDVLDRYAANLVKASGFADKVFFGSSGSEAVEAAIKTIRRYHFVRGNKQRMRILVAEGAFHGRTMGALSTCFHAPSREGFEPLLEGFAPIPFNDIAELEQAMHDDIAAILLEPIQGEGGVRVHSAQYLQTARNLCDRHDALLVFDEVQCGFGRTGQFFAFEQSGITPDIATLAKGIGGGFPLSAMLLTDRAASGMTPGSHGSTYGSNPLAAAVGEAMLTELTKPDFLPHVTKIGTTLRAGLQSLVIDHHHLFTEVRGHGLMLGLALQPGVKKYELANALRAAGLLVSPAVTEVLRILPPLTIEDAHVDEALETLRRVASSKEFA